MDLTGVTGVEKIEKLTCCGIVRYRRTQLVQISKGKNHLCEYRIMNTNLS